MPAYPVSLPSIQPRFHRLPPPPGHALLLAPLSAVCSRLVRSVLGQGVGIGLRKGDTELKDKLNAAIKAIRENGTYAKFNAKYFDFDVYGE